MAAKPLWQDDSVGAAKRVGHYLATEVGEGNKFDKQTLRKIVPGKEQVDRRMRDLRKVGWVIRNYKNMATLKPNELYLEHVGDHVWEDDYSWPSEGLTAAKRRQVYERDGRQCFICGIEFGAEYPDLPGVVARPTIGHIIPKARGGTDDLDNLRPECQLCNEQGRDLTAQPVDVDLLTRRIMELGRADKQRLATWMLAGRRSFTEADRLWSQYVQLPTPAREQVRHVLSDALGQPNGNEAA